MNELCSDEILGDGNYFIGIELPIWMFGFTILY